MNIEPFDHPLRFHVASDSQPEIKHLVDLSENGTLGKCSCQHFEFRLQPLIDAGEITLHPQDRCKHLKAVREHLCNLVVEKLK
jgi:hypothetical protein